MFMLPDNLLAERRQMLLEEEGRSAPDTLLAEAKGGNDYQTLPSKADMWLPWCITCTHQALLRFHEHCGGPVAWQQCSQPILQ